MLQTILNATGLTPQQCASLLGVNESIFHQWVAGQRPIPESYLDLLSEVLGIDQMTMRLSGKQIQARGVASVTPAIWFKFRGSELTDADRECVLLIRQLGHYYNEIEEVTGKKAVGWKPLFEGIRRAVDTQSSPSEQGRQAALMLRESAGLAHGAEGIGTIFRGNLRRFGLLVLESPIPGSRIEGCSFTVGSHPMDRPCVFANTFGSTWFRRNVVLMHEVGHAIFEPSSGASLDFTGADWQTELSEQRAQAFALEALIPRSVLNHVAQTRGIKWTSLSREDIAVLVGETHVEKKDVIHVALINGLITPEYAEQLSSVDISDELRRFSERALPTSEYLARVGEDAKQRHLLGKRTTTIPARALRLPLPYVSHVVEALRDGEIGNGKAAELLMIDKRDLQNRFGDLFELPE